MGDNEFGIYNGTKAELPIKATTKQSQCVLQEMLAECIRAGTTSNTFTDQQLKTTVKVPPTLWIKGVMHHLTTEQTTFVVSCDISFLSVVVQQEWDTKKDNTFAILPLTQEREQFC